jgi:hypothetical protein
MNWKPSLSAPCLNDKTNIRTHSFLFAFFSFSRRRPLTLSRFSPTARSAALCSRMRSVTSFFVSFRSYRFSFRICCLVLIAFFWLFLSFRRWNEARCRVY